MRVKSHHVIKDSSGGWSVKKEGSARVSRKFSTKEEAEKWAKQTAKNQGTAVYVHRADGRIDSKVSYKKGRVSRRG